MHAGLLSTHTHSLRGGQTHAGLHRNSVSPLGQREGGRPVFGSNRGRCAARWPEGTAEYSSFNGALHQPPLMSQSLVTYSARTHARTHKQSASSKKTEDVLISTNESILVPSSQGCVDAAYPYAKLFSSLLSNLFSIYFLSLLLHTHLHTVHTPHFVTDVAILTENTKGGGEILGVEKQKRNNLDKSADIWRWVWHSRRLLGCSWKGKRRQRKKGSKTQTGGSVYPWSFCLRLHI